MAPRPSPSRYAPRNKSPPAHSGLRIVLAGDGLWHGYRHHLDGGSELVRIRALRMTGMTLPGK